MKKKKAPTDRVRPIGIEARRLVLAMGARGWDQSTFAREAGCSLMMVNRVKNGHVGVSDYTLKNWAATLGCSADYLLGLTEIPTRPQGLADQIVALRARSRAKRRTARP